MKRIASVVFAAGAALVLGATTAQAQGINFGVGGGLTIPIGDFGDNFKTGWHGIANIGYNTPTGFGVRGDFYYGQNSLDASVDGKAKLAGGLGNLVYSFQGAGPVRPYVIGGAGVFKAEAEVGNVSDSETKFTWAAGGGVKFKAGTDSNIFVEARYVSISTSGDKTNFIPISAGISFGL